LPETFLGKKELAKTVILSNNLESSLLFSIV